jgi:hypothetical protein
MLYGSKMHHDQVMSLLQLAVEGYIIWSKYQTKKVICIAVSNELSNFKFGYVDNIEPFSKEDEAYIIEDLKMLNWFENIEEIKVNYKEYPK